MGKQNAAAQFEMTEVLHLFFYSMSQSPDVLPLRTNKGLKPLVTGQLAQLQFASVPSLSFYQHRCEN